VYLQALAKEREARQAAAAAAAGSGSSPASRSSAQTLLAPQALKSAPRSIRLARSGGLVLLALAALGLLLGGRTFALLCGLLGAGLARGGGGWLHGLLPAMLQEGRTPTPFEVAGARSQGLFSSQLLAAPLACLSLEYDIALENLAFICTYGKRNCLTSQMYSGPLSLGKVAGLVWGKLSQGIVRCV